MYWEIFVNYRLHNSPAFLHKRTATSLVPLFKCVIFVSSKDKNEKILEKVTPIYLIFKHYRREYIAKGFNQCCRQYETCLHSYKSHYIEGHDCLSIIIQSYYSNIYVRFTYVRVLKICLCYMTCPCFGSSL